MARIRSIKPEFWSSEQIMNCSRDARLLFIGLWNFVDDAGRSPNSAKTIRAQVFPGDEDVKAESVRRLLDELSTNGLLRFYEVDGRSYLKVTGWHHQKIDRPRPSKYPQPPLVEDSPTPRRYLATDLILSEGIRSDLTASGAGDKSNNKEAGSRSLASALPTGALTSVTEGAAPPRSTVKPVTQLTRAELDAHHAARRTAKGAA